MKVALEILKTEFYGVGRFPNGTPVSPVYKVAHNAARKARTKGKMTFEEMLQREIKKNIKNKFGG